MDGISWEVYHVVGCSTQPSERRSSRNGKGWLNHIRRQRGRKSWNTFMYLFHWGKWVLMELSFLIKQPFHITLNFQPKLPNQMLQEIKQEVITQNAEVKDFWHLLVSPLPWLTLAWTSFPTGHLGSVTWQWHLSSCFFTVAVDYQDFKLSWAAKCLHEPSCLLCLITHCH